MIQALFAIGDVNNDGDIDIHEFINVICPAATTVITRIKTNFNTTEDIKVGNVCTRSLVKLV